jgi:hypothetical protein
MPVPRISDDQLREYLDAGNSQADAARHFGVSEPAIHQRLKRMGGLISRVVALERAGELVDDKIDARTALQQSHDAIERELAWAVQVARRAESDRAALVDVILRSADNVRRQLASQISITNALVDPTVVKRSRRDRRRLPTASSSE